jgi:hypothetical protein
MLLADECGIDRREGGNGKNSVRLKPKAPSQSCGALMRV